MLFLIIVTHISMYILHHTPFPVVDLQRQFSDTPPAQFFSLPPAIEVWGKVIFSEACVKNSVHGGVHAWFPGGVRGCGGVCVVMGGVRGCWGACLGHEIRSMSGRYASYWNAFLFLCNFQENLAE